jgi:serine phosphatase RsbU (regulator of sigma subunit)/PAS domain-containing protein
MNLQMIGGGDLSQEAMGVLADAAGVLTSSLEFREAMQGVADLVVPTFGDMCVIDVVGEDGAIRDVAVSAIEDAIAAELVQLRTKHPIDRQSAHPVARVLRSGVAELLPTMDARMLAKFAQGSDHERFMLRMGYHSAVVAPLVGRATTLGTISVLRFGDREPLGPGDLRLVEELARPGALALDNARLYGELRRAEQQFEAILAGLAEAVTVQDAGGQIVYANEAAVRLLGVSDVKELLAAQAGEIAARYEMFDEQGSPVGPDDMPGRRIFVGERPAPMLTRSVRRATGEQRWLLTKASPVSADGGKVRLAVNVIEDVTDVKRAQAYEHFLGEVSKALSSSLDYEATLERVARLAVPEIADWCAVDLLRSERTIEPVAVYHADQHKLALAKRLHDEYPVSPADATGVAAVIRTGTSVLRPAVAMDRLASLSVDTEHLSLLRGIGTRSVLIVPMIAGSRVLGAITLATAESGRTLGRHELALAEELGLRAGTAVENARLYTERGRIDKTLQAAFLPDQLPQLPGVQVAARYRAAGELNEVGGDFYDVFSRGGRDWALVIGDVCGKGAQAARITALARYTLRAAAMLPDSPSQMLQILHAAMRQQLREANMCTVCFGSLELTHDAASLTLALGGHPQPLLLRPGAPARRLGQPGTVLGFLDEVQLTDVEVALAPGDTVLFYTDGLSDAGAPHGRLGEDGLETLVTSLSAADPEQLLDALEDAAVRRSDGRLRDDVALLAIRVS